MKDIFTGQASSSPSPGARRRGSDSGAMDDHGPAGAGAARGARARARRPGRGRGRRGGRRLAGRGRGRRIAAGGSSSGRRASAYVAGLVAQDVQDALLERYGRWPLCPVCDAGDPHALDVEPELGPDPHWVCAQGGDVVARWGRWTWLGRPYGDRGTRRRRVTVYIDPPDLAGPRPAVVPPGQRRLVRGTARLRGRDRLPAPRLRARPLRRAVARYADAVAAGAVEVGSKELVRRLTDAGLRRPKRRGPAPSP